VTQASLPSSARLSGFDLANVAAALSQLRAFVKSVAAEFHTYSVTASARAEHAHVIAVALADRGDHVERSACSLCVSRVKISDAAARPRVTSVITMSSLQAEARAGRDLHSGHAKAARRYAQRDRRDPQALRL